MKQPIVVNRQDILHCLKLSCKMGGIVKQISNCKLIELLAKEAHISISAEDFERTANNFRIENQLCTSKDTFRWMHQHLLSLDDFQTIIYTNALGEKLARHLFMDSVDSWFKEHQSDYAKAVIYELILQNEDLATELYATLQKPQACFYEIVRQYIKDRLRQDIKRFLGLVDSQVLTPEIKTSVFNASPPVVLKPIITKRGTHLILVEEIIEPILDKQLKNQIMLELFDRWLVEKSQSYDVRLQIY